jgi:hypothetical protein
MKGTRQLLRFAFLGVGGLWLSALCGLSLAMDLFGHDKPILHPALACTGLLSAALAMLAGVGQWGRWLYLIPFLTWPFVLTPFLRIDSYGGVLVGAVLAFSPVWLISTWYRRKQPMYPEIQASGSLAAALQDALRSLGSTLSTDSQVSALPVSYARVEAGPRFVQLYVAAEERLFLTEFWAQGVALASGNCPDLIETASAIDCWVSSECMLTKAIHEKFSWVTPKAKADAFESGNEVEWKWQQMLSNTSHSEELRLAVLRASENPRLRMLFPYTSLFTLCFSRCTGYPFTQDVPCITPTGPGQFSVTHMNEEPIGKGDIGTCIDLVVAHLPPDCGAARRGTAEQ